MTDWQTEGSQIEGFRGGNRHLDGSLSRMKSRKPHVAALNGLTILIWNQ